MRDLSDRVWPEPNSGCHLWSGGVTDRGYGRVLIQGKRRKAHRVIWEEKYGSVPSGAAQQAYYHRNRVRLIQEAIKRKARLKGMTA